MLCVCPPDCTGFSGNGIAAMLPVSVDYAPNQSGDEESSSHRH